MTRQTYRTPGKDPLEARITASIKRGVTEAGLTKREFAEAVGTSEGLVWRWLEGKTLPSALLIPRISDVLFDGDINALFGRAVERYTTTMKVA